MASKCEIPKLLDLIGLGLGFIALVLHTLGTAFPYWWVVHEHDPRNLLVEWTFYYGIWEIVNCKDGVCIYMSSRMENDRAWLIGPAVLLVFSAVLLLAAFVCTCTHFRQNARASAFRKTSVILSAGAGGVIILAVLIFYKKKAGLRPWFAPETSAGDPGWALFLSTVGAIVAVVNGIVIGISVNRYSYRNLEKRKSIFGICAQELEIDVNALRQGQLLQGKDINKTSFRGIDVQDLNKTSTSYFMTSSTQSSRKNSEQNECSVTTLSSSFRSK